MSDPELEAEKEYSVRMGVEGNVIMPSSDVSTNMDAHPDRMKNTHEAVSKNGEKARVKALSKFSKNSRKSRNSKGRGLAKKGGGGGKGVWGKPGDEMVVENGFDVKDPNYSSEEDTCGNVIIKKVVVPDSRSYSVHHDLSKDNFDRLISPVILEYLETGDSESVLEELEDRFFLVPDSILTFQIVVLSITISLGRNAFHRELVSRLLSDLYGELFSSDDMATGLEAVMAQLPDLAIDYLDAPDTVGMFIARAVADDCLPPAFIRKHTSTNVAAIERCLKKADILLSMPHGIVRLDSIWGVGGGIRPVKALVKKIKLLLEEYISSGDTDEAQKCLKELAVPHFHHEVVYELVYLVLELEPWDNKKAKLMANLLAKLCVFVIITVNQLEQGMHRIYNELPDLKVDIPHAHTYLDNFLAICEELQFFPKNLLEDAPTEARKRFVSEGDGGKIKNKE